MLSHSTYILFPNILMTVIANFDFSPLSVMMFFTLMIFNYHLNYQVIDAVIIAFCR